MGRTRFPRSARNDSTEKREIMLKEGDAAPEFALQDETEKTVQLKDFRGHPLVVYFYPRADTPG